MNNTPKSQAGSLVMAKPSSSDGSSIQNDGNVLLMEARMTELVSNIRALDDSNKQLEEALVDEPNDIDFVQAIKENKELIQKKAG